VRYLLDTNVLLFSWLDSDSLSSAVRQIVESTENELYYSQASILEISLKYSIGKLPLPASPKEYIPSCVTRMGLERAELSDDVLYQSMELPMHHKDPFDRAIIATAQSMSLPLLSKDRVFEAYDVELIW
jgi:PIN domain nuclease of toxin-antitoxin system